jgi:hypothetical protein
MKKEKTYLILLFTMLLCINPALGLDSTMSQMFQRFRPLPKDFVLGIDSLVALLACLFLYFGFRRPKESINSPQNVVLILYIVLVANVGQLTTLVFIGDRSFSFCSYLLYATVEELIGTLGIILCVQQISKYCGEGYEGFSINVVSGCINFAILVSNFLGDNVIGSYLDKSTDLPSSIGYTAVLCLELAAIPLLLAFYFFKLRS